MKSTSLLADRTVESRQLFKILEHLPSFLLTNECPLVCSIAILLIQRLMRIVVNKKYELIQVMGDLYRYMS